VPRVHNLEELNRLLESGADQEQARLITGRCQTIGALMLAEREHLLPLADEGFDLAALHFPQINQSGCVKVLTNFYSTPLPVEPRSRPRSTRLMLRSGTVGIAWRSMNVATSAISRCWNWIIIWM